MLTVFNGNSEISFDLIKKKDTLELFSICTNFVFPRNLKTKQYVLVDLF